MVENSWNTYLLYTGSILYLFRVGKCPSLRYHSSPALSLISGRETWITTIISWVRLRKFGYQGLAFCCQGQLAPFPVATYRPLTSLTAKRAKLQATTLWPLETWKVSCGDTVILSTKVCHQCSVVPYSIGNGSRLMAWDDWHFRLSVSDRFKSSVGMFI